MNKVNKPIKNLGKELLNHELIGHCFLEPLKSQGVFMMEDSAMIIRVKFKTRPGEQFQARKIIYAEIRSLFERKGIQFASREVKVLLHEDDPRVPPDRRGKGQDRRRRSSRPRCRKPKAAAVLRRRCVSASLFPVVLQRPRVQRRRKAGVGHPFRREFSRTGCCSRRSSRLSKTALTT